ncbi:hypothetical protein acdb102_10250 [Acidothermaceae bacterium B102]|nr:hypothetical protein acdb102_10250 [Acidothermaceae bacterium B102]
MREDDGFADYVERYGRHLVQVAYLLTGDEGVARDVVQRALSRAWLSWGRLSELPNPDSYFLRGVVTSRALRHEPHDDDPLAWLRREQRAAIVLRFFEGLPDGRMAAVMDTPQATARSVLEAGVAALDVTDLGNVLRARAEDVGDESLLPAVRARADKVRRLRLGGVIGAGVLVVVVVAGVADLALTASQRAPAGARPVLDPQALQGKTWYLTSWTTSSGSVVEPASGPAPSLVFQSRTTATTTDPAETTWIFRLGQGTAVGVLVHGGTSTAAAVSSDAAVTTVLEGTSSWRITGTTLVFHKGPYNLTYSSDPAAAQHG